MNAREVIARALVKRNYPNATEADLAEMVEGFMPDADAALSDLKAAGMAIVPVEATEAMITAAWRREPGHPNPSEAYRAMIAAAKDQTND